MLHSDPGSGHFGITQMAAGVKERFYWTGYSDAIKVWCTRCRECQKRRGTPMIHRGKMKQYIV